MKNIVFQLFALFISSSLCGQIPQMGPIYPLGDGFSSCNEPAVIMSTKNENTLLSATNTKHLFWSKNQGKTYKHQQAESRYGVYGDPVLVRNEQGDIFYIHLAKAPNKPWPDCFDRIVVQKSEDEGRTFTDGVGIGYNGRMQDKPWASFDTYPGSPFRGRMYVSWTEFDRYNSTSSTDSSRILCSYSLHNADSFAVPVRVSDRGGNCLDDNETVEGATTAALPDGRVVCVWAGHEQLYIDMSSDGGKTWGPDQIIDSLPGGWNLNIPGFSRNNGLPFVCSDSKGNLTVVTCRNSGTPPLVTIYESQDAGKHWNKTFFEGIPNEAHMMPIIQNDRKSGLTGILYYSVQPYGVSVKLAWRHANNQAWQELTVNDGLFPPPGKTTFFGDYLGLDVLNKSMQAIWTETTPKGTRVCTRRIVFP